MRTTVTPFDPERLLRQRLVIARFGEMDLAGWWNTSGQLGRLGAAALRRGFPKTHYFAQARSDRLEDRICKQRVRFLAPVHSGDTITGVLEVTNVRPDKPIVTLAATITNQAGRKVADGELVVLVRDPDGRGHAISSREHPLRQRSTKAHAPAH